MTRLEDADLALVDVLERDKRGMASIRIRPIHGYGATDLKPRSDGGDAHPRAEKIAIQTGIDLEIIDRRPLGFGRRRESPSIGQVKLVF